MLPAPRGVTAFAIAFLFLFAGCLGGDGVDAGANLSTGSETPSPSATTGPSPSTSPSASGGPSGTSPPPNNTTEPPGGGGDPGNNTNDTLAPPTWPPIGSATIRPGIKLLVGNSYCTANFVFRSPTNGTLYIGTAAHCASVPTEDGGCTYDAVGLRVSAPPDTTYVTGANGPEFGTVVYSSYGVLDHECDPDSTAHTEDNDFVLIQIDADQADSVHPAMLHFGGPTALAPLDDVTNMDKVINFGNSALRPGPEQFDWHEGYVTGTSPWRVTAYMLTPDIPGDSGSGAMLGDGRALGIVVSLATVPPLQTGITPLEPAMAFAAENGWPVELMTWELLDGGLLP